MVCVCVCVCVFYHTLQRYKWVDCGRRAPLTKRRGAATLKHQLSNEFVLIPDVLNTPSFHYFRLIFLSVPVLSPLHFTLISPLSSLLHLSISPLVRYFHFFLFPMRGYTTCEISLVSIYKDCPFESICYAYLAYATCERSVLHHVYIKICVTSSSE